MWTRPDQTILTNVFVFIDKYIFLVLTNACVLYWQMYLCTLVFFSNCKMHLVKLHFLGRFLVTRWLPRIQCDNKKLFHLVPWYKFSTFAKNKVKWNFNLDLSSICLKPEQLKDTHLWAWGTDYLCQVMGLKLYQPFLGEVMETGKSLGLIQYKSRFQILNKVFASKHLFKIGINSL